MHNLVALYGNVAQDASLVNLTPVTDSLVSIQNSRFLFPMRAQIGAILMNVPNGSRARINTPMYRNIALPEIYPVKTSAGNGSNPPIMGPIWGSLEIPMNDEFGIDVSRAGSGAADCFGGIWYAPGMTPATRGPVITMRATATITLTVGTWVSANLTFDQSLPNGTYEVVGMQATMTNLMFARLIFPGGINYRPGVPGTVTYGDYVNPQVFRFGNFGSYGRFVSTAQPLIEVMGLAAGSQAGVFLLDLIKVS